MSRILAAVVLVSSVVALAETAVAPPFTYNPDLAWDGAKFGMTYRSGAGFELRFRTVSISGQALGLEATVEVGGSEADLARGSGVWAASWANGLQVRFGAFDDSGIFVITPRTLSSATGSDRAGRARIVWTGTRYWISWAQGTSTYSEARIIALDGSGNVIVPNTVLHPDPALGPLLAWDTGSSALALAWGPNPAGSTVNPYATETISSAGSLNGPGSIASPANAYSVYGSMAGDGNGLGLAYLCDLTLGPLGYRNPYFTPLDGNADPVTAPVLISNEDIRQPGPLIWTGAAFFWPMEYVGGGTIQNYVYRFTRAGGLMGSKVMLTDAPSVLPNFAWGAHAAMADRLVGVAWEDDRTTSNGEIWYQPVPTTEILVGGGGGASNPPEVRSISTFRAEAVLDFFAYGASGYGCNVAAGNIDPQTLDEILTAPGPGPPYGPQVRAFTGGQDPLAKVNFYAYGTLKYGSHVSASDLDGEGMAEILRGAGAGAVFGPHVRGWNYDGASVGAMPKISFFAYNTLKYGVKVAGGDVDGDGYGEILTGPGPNVMFGPQLRGFNYDNLTIAAISKINTWPFATRYGLVPGVADVTADGRDEILASPGPDPAAATDVRVYDYPGSLVLLATLTPFPAYLGGSHASGGDLDLQVGDEIVVTPGFLPANTGALKAYAYVGGSFTPINAYDQTVFGRGYGATCAVGNVGI